MTHICVWDVETWGGLIGTRGRSVSIARYTWRRAFLALFPCFSAQCTMNRKFFQTVLVQFLQLYHRFSIGTLLNCAHLTRNPKIQMKKGQCFHFNLNLCPKMSIGLAYSTNLGKLRSLFERACVDGLFLTVACASQIHELKWLQKSVLVLKCCSLIFTRLVFWKNIFKIYLSL